MLREAGRAPVRAFLVAGAVLCLGFGLRLTVGSRRAPTPTGGEGHGVHPVVSSGVSTVVSRRAEPPASPGLAFATRTECSASHDDGWCDDCSRGWVAGVPVPSAALFEVLDAHGHDIDAALLRCTVCRRHARDGGYCERCRMGFVGGLAYLSRLSFLAARSRRLAAPGCGCGVGSRAHWCGDRGVRGDRAWSDRAEFEAALLEFEHLGASIALLDRCEECAIAAFTGGVCGRCEVESRPDRDRHRRSARTRG